jgi:hypothetical protein
MKKLTVRASDSEWELLAAFCEAENRTQNDVIRELIRSLKKRGRGGNSSQR